MLTTARRLMLVLVPVTLALTVTMPARAAAAPPPLPEGPWPPRQVLAADPSGVAATPDVVSTGCPTTTATVNRSAPGSGRTVALTFDDGPGATTFALLGILQQYGVTATFFNLGANASRRPAEVRSEAAIGVQLANHTWDHPKLTGLSATAQGDQMDAASAEQATLVGSYPCAFRPPYGSYTSASVAQSQLRRMSFWTWSVDTEDWKATTSTTSYWVNRIISRAEAGVSQTHPVILMHNPPAGVPATVIALPTIIRFYRDHGYRFVDLLGNSGHYPAPAATTTSAGLQLAARFSDGSVRVRRLTSTGWKAWISLGGNAVSGPGIAGSTDTSYVVHLGTNNAVWMRTRSDSGALGSWTSLGGIGTSKPTVAFRANHLWVAVRGTDRAYWLRELSGRTWGPWISLTGTMTSAPTLAVTADGGLTIAGVSTDGALWERHRGTTWSSWHRVGGTVTADPVLAATSGGAGLVAMVRGTDGRAWVTVADASAGTWSAWTPIPGLLGSGAGLTARGRTLEAFAYGTDGLIRRSVASNGANATGWSAWQLTG